MANKAQAVLYHDRVHVIIDERVFTLDQANAERLLYSLHDCVGLLRGYQKRPPFIKRLLRRKA